jgi:hypothetical protein
MRRPGVLVLTLFLMAASSTVLSAEGALRLERQEGKLFYYQGSVALEGFAERRVGTEGEGAEHEPLCFVAEGPSRQRIPRVNDARLPWFCFSNPARAAQLLSLPRQLRRGSCGFRVKASVLVDGYVVNREESAVTDTARLLAVRQLAGLEWIPCRAAQP